MKRITLFSGALVAALLMATVATRAHHSFAMFDMNKDVTYEEGRRVMDEPPHAHHDSGAATAKDPRPSARGTLKAAAPTS
jgi:hypothetical protein